MGAARSRSHRAGGRPSTRTRMLLLHAVRVAVAAEARGGPRQGAHTFVFGVTRLTPPGRPIVRRCGVQLVPRFVRRCSSFARLSDDAVSFVQRCGRIVRHCGLGLRSDTFIIRLRKTEFHSCEILGLWL